jgi:ABC-type Na+ efflux pump permease subunit
MRRTILICRKELLEFIRDKRLSIPFFILSLGFPIFFQFMLFGVTMVAAPASGAAHVKAVNGIIAKIFPTFLLMIAVCTMAFSLGMAVESFVGEKERKTLEPLLAAPISDVQLFVSKCLAATAPPVVMCYLSCALFVGLSAWRLGRAGIAIPLTGENVLFLAVFAPLAALLMCSAAAVVSAWASSVKSASQIAGFAIVFFILLVQVRGQAILESRSAMALTAGGLLAADILALTIGCMLFRRDRLVY